MCLIFCGFSVLVERIFKLIFECSLSKPLNNIGSAVQNSGPQQAFSLKSAQIRQWFQRKSVIRNYNRLPICILFVFSIELDKNLSSWNLPDHNQPFKCRVICHATILEMRNFYLPLPLHQHCVFSLVFCEFQLYLMQSPHFNIGLKLSSPSRHMVVSQKNRFLGYDSF
jgi:hypothetical protein